MRKYGLYNICEIINEPSLRCDVDFVKNSYEKSQLNFVKFTDLFEILSKDNVDIESLDYPFKYCQIGDVDNKNNKNFKVIDFSNELVELNDYYKKIKKGDIFLPKKNTILISKVRPYLRKIVLASEGDIYYSTAFICLKPKINPVIAYFFLYFILSKDIDVASRQGKGYPTIKDDDLINLNIFKKDFDCANKLDNDNQLIEELTRELKKISDLKVTLIDENKAIDDAIINSLNISLKTFHEKCEEKKYVKQLCDVVNNIDLRCSAKFNRPSKNIIENIQIENNFIQLKYIVAKEGELGSSISPENYIEVPTGKYYISMADISSYYIDKDNLKNVTEEYFDNEIKKQVEINDILITRSGEGGIGKVALVEEDVDGIFCDFIMRYKIKKGFSPKFIYYYMRSIFFRYFVEVNKKGLGNNTNIFPNQVQYFRVPNISLIKQNEIVFEIDTILNKNKTIMNKIDEIYDNIGNKFNF